MVTKAEAEAWASMELKNMQPLLERLAAMKPLSVCPSCGLGRSRAGVHLVTRPQLVITDDNLCADCRTRFKDTIPWKDQDSVRRAWSAPSMLASITANTGLK